MRAIPVRPGEEITLMRDRGGRIAGVAKAPRFEVEVKGGVIVFRVTQTVYRTEGGKDR